ncbi:hypothetical protein DC498_23110 [Terrimonas sp.]|nr:hypothetical protein DC498_23110 [Terrimonas sp.]
MIMKNVAQVKQDQKKGFSNSRPPARDKLDSRGDLEINENPAVHNKKKLRKGVKDKNNDPQGTRLKK